MTTKISKRYLIKNSKSADSSKCRATTPKQAAMKAFTSFCRKHPEELTADISVQEITKDPKDQIIYKYSLQKEKLRKPEKIEIKDRNGDTKKLTYEYRTNIVFIGTEIN